jgi:hypothetical protein
MIYLGSISDDTQGAPLTVVLCEDEARTLAPGQIYPV